MKVTSTTAIRPQPVELEGAEKVSVRVLLGEADGAPTFTMRLFDVEAEGHTPRHAHPYEHQIIVQKGTGMLWTPDRQYELAPGMVALVAPDEEHQFQAGPDGLLFFCIVPNRGHKV